MGRRGVEIELCSVKNATASCVKAVTMISVDPTPSDSMTDERTSWQQQQRLELPVVHPAPGGEKVTDRRQRSE